jgi:hypothetical protein
MINTSVSDSIPEQLLSQEDIGVNPEMENGKWSSALWNL